jgi:hypothetical protein
MTVALAAGTAYTELRMVFEDAGGSKYTVNLYLNLNPFDATTGAADTTAINNIVGDFCALSYAKVTASVFVIYPGAFTGTTATATDGPGTDVKDALELVASRANPLVPTRTWNVAVPIPAPIWDAAPNDGTGAVNRNPSYGYGDFSNANLAALETALNTKLLARYGGNSVLYGSFSINENKSQVVNLAGTIAKET